MTDHNDDDNYYDTADRKLPKDIATQDGDRANFSNTSPDQRHAYMEELWWTLLQSFLNALKDPETKFKGSSLQVIVGFLKDNGMNAEALQEASHGGGGLFGSKLANVMAALKDDNDPDGGQGGTGH